MKQPILTIKNKKISQDKIPQGQAETLSLDHIIKDLQQGKYNLSPPYQREIVWSEDYSTDLIRSILTGMTISNLHLVQEKEDDDKFLVLDGKQRLTSISNFVKNSIKVRVSLEGKIRALSFKDLMDDSSLEWLRAKFLGAQIHIIKYPYCDLPTQKRIFLKVNKSVNLKPAELNYCENFLTKGFLGDAFEDMQNGVDGIGKTLTNAPFFKNKRYRAHEWFHKLLIQSFGIDLDTWSDRFIPVDGHAIKKSAAALEEKLSEYHENDSEGDGYLKEYGWDKKLKSLSEAWKLVSRVVERKRTQMSQLDRIFILDVVSFLAKKLHKQDITKAFIDAEFNKFVEFVFGWWEFMNKNADLKTRTTDKTKQNEKYDFIQGQFQAKFGIIAIKPAKPTVKQKSDAARVSGEECPMCKGPLTVENRELHHIHHNSLSANKDVEYICRPCNRKMSNSTETDLENQLNYTRNKKAKVDAELEFAL